MILRVDVDVPFTVCKLPGLIRGESGLPGDRVFDRTALFDHRDLGSSILARLRRAMELSHGDWTGESRNSGFKSLNRGLTGWKGSVGAEHTARFLGYRGYELQNMLQTWQLFVGEHEDHLGRAGRY